MPAETLNTLLPTFSSRIYTDGKLRDASGFTHFDRLAVSQAAAQIRGCTDMLSELSIFLHSSPDILGTNAVCNRGMPNDLHSSSLTRQR